MCNFTNNVHWQNGLPPRYVFGKKWVKRVVEINVCHVIVVLISFHVNIGSGFSI